MSKLSKLHDIVNNIENTGYLIEAIAEPDDIEALTKEALDPETHPERLRELYHRNRGYGTHRGLRVKPILGKYGVRQEIGHHLASNPSLPEDLFRQLFEKHPEEAYNNPILSLLELEDPNYLSNLPYSALKAIAKSEKTPSDLLSRLYATNDSLPKYKTATYGGPTRSEELLFSLAKNNNFPKKHLDYLANKAANVEDHNDQSFFSSIDHPIIDKGLAKNKNLNDHVLSTLFTKEDISDDLVNNFSDKISSNYKLLKPYMNALAENNLAKSVVKHKPELIDTLIKQEPNLNPALLNVPELAQKYKSHILKNDPHAIIDAMDRGDTLYNDSDAISSLLQHIDSNFDVAHHVSRSNLPDYIREAGTYALMDYGKNNQFDNYTKHYDNDVHRLITHKDPEVAYSLLDNPSLSKEQKKQIFSKIPKIIHKQMNDIKAVEKATIAKNRIAADKKILRNVPAISADGKKYNIPPADPEEPYYISNQGEFYKKSDVLGFDPDEDASNDNFSKEHK